MGELLWHTQNFYQDFSLNRFKDGNWLLEVETSLDAALMCAAFVEKVCIFRIGGLDH